MQPHMYYKIARHILQYYPEDFIRLKYINRGFNQATDKLYSEFIQSYFKKQLPFHEYISKHSVTYDDLISGVIRCSNIIYIHEFLPIRIEITRNDVIPSGGNLNISIGNKLLSLMRGGIVLDPQKLSPDAIHVLKFMVNHMSVIYLAIIGFYSEKSL